MARGASWLAIGLCIASPTIAQQHRGEVFGTVQLRGDDAAIATWAGAHVVLVSHPFPFDARVGESDRIECTLDERARFHSMLLQGRSYSAWAWHESTDGTRSFTRVLTAVRAGMPVVLEPEATPRPAIAVRVEGVRAWNTRGALRCIATADDELDRGEVEVREDGTVTIPALPGDRIAVCVCRADGMPLSHSACGPQALRGRPHLAFDLAPPNAYAVHVTDAQGRPVQGAEIRRLPSAPTLVLATTAADGTANLTLPRPGFVHRGLVLGGDVLVAQAPGHAPGMLFADQPDGLKCVMTPVKAVHGHIVFDARTPAPHVHVVLLQRIDDPDDRTQPAFVTTTARTDERGRFEFASWSGDWTRSSIALVLSGDHEAAGSDPLVVDAFDSNSVAGDDGDLGTLDLHTLAHLELRVREPDGSPAAFALCRRRVAERLEPFDLTETRTDACGLLRLLVRVTDAPIYLAGRQGSALLEALPQPKQTGRLLNVDIDLRARRVFEGRITDAGGRPVAHREYEIGYPPCTVRRLAGNGARFAFSCLSNTPRPPLEVEPMTAFSTDDDGRFEVAIDDSDFAIDIRRRLQASGTPDRRFTVMVTEGSETLLTITHAETTRGLEIVDPQPRH